MFELVSSRSRDATRRALPPETGPTRPVVRTRQIATLPGPWGGPSPIEHPQLCAIPPDHWWPYGNRALWPSLWRWLTVTGRTAGTMPAIFLHRAVLRSAELGWGRRRDLAGCGRPGMVLSRFACNHSPMPTSAAVDLAALDHDRTGVQAMELGPRQTNSPPIARFAFPPACSSRRKHLDEMSILMTELS
jgi:hypothetical protein